MTISKIPRWVLLLVCVFATLAAWRFASSTVTAATAKAEVARQETRQAVADAGHALALAGIAQRQVDSLRSQRDSAATRASTFERSAARLSGKLAALAVAAPDTCRPIILTADSLVAAQDSVIGSLHVALDRSIASERHLQIVVDTLSSSLVRFRTAATTLIKADEKVARRSLLAKLLPRPGIGIAAGFDPAGMPHVLTGITLGWSF